MPLLKNAYVIELLVLMIIVSAVNLYRFISLGPEPVNRNSPNYS